MPQVSPPARAPDPAAAVLGYLNFSAGVFDPAVWRGWSDLFAVVEPAASGPVEERSDAAAAVIRLLRERLDGLEAAEPAFRDARQARQALSVLEERLLPGYRAFHVDLLEHQPPGAIERPFFLAAAAQALLACGWSADDVPADEPAVTAKVTEAIGRLNDYVGWRPVAVLENGRLSEPYPHERVRPLPVYVAGAGVAHGRYHDLVAGALDILGSAPPGLLEQADFDPALLEELAIDPRAFDFLHPAASRPNYLFGLWDPERIDARGNYRRMVVQQATLDGILSWPSTTPDEAPGRETELFREASAVLAGVMLMASGLSGRGPGSHQGGLPLAELLPRIAGYRDEFYHWLLGTLPDEHRRRLEAEMQRLRQPFGGVRRHINALLATRRARQVENVTLAAVLARLGRSTGAERLAARVPAASARLLARITSLVVSARRDLRGSDRRAGANESLAHLDSATDLLFRAVGCGATVDPWNILGLGGQFPLHEPGGESLADPRVDDLIAVTRSILEAYAAVWRTSGLDGPDAVATRAAAALERIASWWDRYATTTVSGVPHLSGRQILDSTREVIAALEGRRAFVGAAPPAAFWRKAVGSFSAPESHAQAATALLDEGDLDGAMGLLVHWASLLEGPAVEQSGPDWLAAAARWTARAGADTSPAGRARVRRFLELVEANTSGVVDCLEQVAARGDAAGRSTGDAEDAIGDGEAPPDDQQEERVVSAYESMVWRDSTDDGVEGGMLDVDLPGGARAGDAADVERAAEFLAGICRLLRHAVTTCCAIDARERSAPSRADIDSALGWRHTLKRLRRTFVRAADHLAATDSTPPPGMAPAEYDRLRWQRDAAVERLIDAAVQATETLRILSAWLALGGATAAGGRSAVGRLFAALLSGDADGARAALAPVQERLAGKAVLYVPLSRGGRPSRIVAARSRERLLERLAACLPRLGLVAETTSIVKLAKSLESHRPPGAASVSEFDRVFEAATGALVERIVESAGTPAPDESAPEPSVVTERILAGLARLVPSLLETWMTHARQLRLSVLERLRDPKAFTATREFIERYGAGLFTQHLLTPPALRGILRGGVKHFVEQLVERHAAEPPETSTEGRPRYPARLVEDLAHGVLTVRQAAARLRLVLECIAENHAEYRDWNSTTAHSDRGEHLHMLLEFLRLKAEYERIAWTLRPVGMAHRVLARRGLHDAAAAWRGRMRDETGATAADLAGRLTALESFWGVRLASVADRVGRPFTAVLEQDELEALVPPAVREATCGAPVGAGARLEERAEGMLGQASGSGVEVPDWLERVSDVVDRAIERAEGGSDLELRPGTLPDAVPWVPVPWDAVEALLAGGQDPPAR